MHFFEVEKFERNDNKSCLFLQKSRWLLGFIVTSIKKSLSELINCSVSKRQERFPKMQCLLLPFVSKYQNSNVI